MCPEALWEPWNDSACRVSESYRRGQLKLLCSGLALFRLTITQVENENFLSKLSYFFIIWLDVTYRDNRQHLAMRMIAMYWVLTKAVGIWGPAIVVLLSQWDPMGIYFVQSLRTLDSVVCCNIHSYIRIAINWIVPILMGIESNRQVCWYYRSNMFHFNWSHPIAMSRQCNSVLLAIKQSFQISSADDFRITFSIFSLHWFPFFLWAFDTAASHFPILTPQRRNAVKIGREAAERNKKRVVISLADWQDKRRCIPSRQLFFFPPDVMQIMLPSAGNDEPGWREKPPFMQKS